MTNSILQELERKLKQRNELDLLVHSMIKFLNGLKLPSHVEAQLDFWKRKHEAILNRIDEFPG